MVRASLKDCEVQGDFKTEWKKKLTGLRFSLRKSPARKRSGPSVLWVAHSIPAWLELVESETCWLELLIKENWWNSVYFQGLKLILSRSQPLVLASRSYFWVLSKYENCDLASILLSSARWVYSRGQPCVSPYPLGATMALPKPGVCRPKWFFCLRRHSRDLYLEGCIRHFQGSVLLRRESEAWTKVFPHTRVLSSIIVLLLLRFLSCKVKWAWGVCPGKKAWAKDCT